MQENWLNKKMAEIVHYFKNILLVFVFTAIVELIYFEINNIDFDFNILLSSLWSFLRRPFVFIPIIIVIFIKDTLKPLLNALYIKCNGAPVKREIALVVFIAFSVLFIKIFNIRVFVSFVVAYLYTAYKFTLAYGDFHHVIASNMFFVVFLVSLFITNIFFRKQNKEDK